MTKNLPIEAQSLPHKALAHLMREECNEARLINLMNYKRSKISFNTDVILPLTRAMAVTAKINNIYGITNKGVDLYMALQDIEAVYIGTEIPKMATTRKTFAVDGPLYDGAELRPYEGRPGANDFLKYPSRMGAQLIYRKDAQ
jgi:hypothetical protein